MTKKEYLLALFEKFEHYFEEVIGLRILVQHDILDDIILDKIYTFFESKVNEVLNENEKKRIKQTTIILKKIRQMEDDDSDNADIDYLVNML